MLFSMLFVYFCPIYFAVGKIHIRTISLPERFCSLLFVLVWLTLCVYCAWKKRLPFLFGGIAFSLMAYLPGWFLPHLTAAADASKEPGLVSVVFKFVFEKMYELVNAPLVGVSLLVSPKEAIHLSRNLLPVLVICYVGTQLFRYYRNAYLAAELHIEDTAYSSNPDLARELAVALQGNSEVKVAADTDVSDVSDISDSSTISDVSDSSDVATISNISDSSDVATIAHVATDMDIATGTDDTDDTDIRSGHAIGDPNQ